jgi:hypothetical protein
MTWLLCADACPATAKKQRLVSNSLASRNLNIGDIHHTSSELKLSGGCGRSIAPLQFELRDGGANIPGPAIEVFRQWIAKRLEVWGKNWKLRFLISGNTTYPELLIVSHLSVSTLLSACHILLQRCNLLPRESRGSRDEVRGHGFREKLSGEIQ